MEFKRHGSFYVYIVQCRNGTLYTGYTNDLKKRIKLHNEGKGAKYLRGKAPIKLVWSKKYKYYKWAVRLEVLIKKLTKPQKQTIIDGKPLYKVFADNS